MKEVNGRATIIMVDESGVERGSRLTRPRTIRPWNLDFSLCSIESSFPHLFWLLFMRLFLEDSFVLHLPSLSFCLFLLLGLLNTLFHQPMAMTDPVNTEIRHRDILFVTTQRGRDVPVINGYIFFPKDKKRKDSSAAQRIVALQSLSVKTDTDNTTHQSPRTTTHLTMSLSDTWRTEIN